MIDGKIWGSFISVKKRKCTCSVGVCSTGNLVSSQSRLLHATSFAMATVEIIQAVKQILKTCQLSALNDTCSLHLAGDVAPINTTWFPISTWLDSASWEDYQKGRLQYLYFTRLFCGFSCSNLFFSYQLLCFTVWFQTGNRSRVQACTSVTVPSNMWALTELTLWLQFNNDRWSQSCHSCLQALTHRHQAGVAALSVRVQHWQPYTGWANHWQLGQSGSYTLSLLREIRRHKELQIQSILFINSFTWCTSILYYVIFFQQINNLKSKNPKYMI